MFITGQIDLWDLDDNFFYEGVKDHVEAVLSSEGEVVHDIVMTYINC